MRLFESHKFPNSIIIAAIKLSLYMIFPGIFLFDFVRITEWSGMRRETEKHGPGFFAFIYITESAKISYNFHATS